MLRSVTHGVDAPRSIKRGTVARIWRFASPYRRGRAVYGHVQTMPVAFFTRTRTGALVSRLNNDVIGAQSAITSTLASVVANVIQLTLAVTVMITLAWQVTVLALVLLPIFVIPAR